MRGREVMSSGLALIMLLALLVTSAGCMPGLEPGPESEAADAAGETAEQAASETTTLEAETASAPSESSPWSRRPFSLSGTRISPAHSPSPWRRSTPGLKSFRGMT
jgi:hypothetical protein